MKEFKDVLGSMDVVQNLEFNVDTVYDRCNIDRVYVDGVELWKYDEVQYSYEEYTKLNSNKIAVLTEEIKELKEFNTRLINTLRNDANILI